jgi:hypothetical protein
VADRTGSDPAGTGVPVNRDDADRAITALGATYDQIATAMYAIDSDPALGFLRAGGLAGKTEKLWTALSPEIDERWSEFSTFGGALEQARTTREQRRPVDPEWAEMQRTLAVDGPRLAGSMASGCATIMAILADVNTAWSAASAATAPVTDAMATLSRRAGELGDTDGIAALSGRVAMAADQAMTDPLTNAPGGILEPAVRRELGNLSADIAAASARIADQVRVRDSYPDRLAELVGLIDAVDRDEDGVRVAFARAVEKITDPELPPAPHTGDVLRARLSELDARYAGQQWRRLADDVAMMETTIAHARERATELTEAADGLVARRDELRGRLDAYRAKAARHRLDEHDALGPLHAHARALLYTAPCDLHAATKAVYAYQKTLTELVRPQEGPIR